MFVLRNTAIFVYFERLGRPSLYCTCTLLVFVARRVFYTLFKKTYVKDWDNPGLTRNLQPLLFLFFVAWRTRQVGARFDGEPSDGNDRSALRQRKVLRRQNRESTEIPCQRET